MSEEQLPQLDTAAIEARIQKGRDDIDWFPVPEWGGKVPLRPLTDGEWNEIQSLINRGQVMRRVRDPGSEEAEPPSEQAGPEKNAEETGPETRRDERVELEIDLEAMLKASHESDYIAVACAMADGKVRTPEDVAAFRPAGVVKRIAARVYEISDVAKVLEETVRSFREVAKGPEAPAAAPDGGAAGPDAG